MQIKTAAVLLAFLGSAHTAPAPGTSTVRSLGRRGDGHILAGRQTPNPEERCAEAEVVEMCDCSRIPKDNIEGWFQCVTNALCEWCAGLWTDDHEEEEKKPDKPGKPKANKFQTRGRDLLWK